MKCKRLGMQLRSVLLLLLGATLLFAGCRDGASNAATPSTRAATQVERQLIETANPVTAQGQELQLTRVFVPAGMEIPPHTHPGPQLAVIAEGTLTYTVLNGEAQITRQAGSSEARSEVIRSGQTVDLRPGDSVSEPTGMVHQARNNGSKMVVIYTSSLYPQGAPASSPAP